MAELPTGTVTFLFTDIEDSTTRWEQQSQAMQAALAHHDSILRSAILAHRGTVVKTTGDGFHAVFRTAQDGVAAALAAQDTLQSADWGASGPIRVRMALHTGSAEERDGDYYGPTLNRAARLMAAGHGGQILISLATQELVRDHLPPEMTLRDLGEHHLKDLVRPEQVYQVSSAGLAAGFPPLRTLDNRPNNLPLQSTPLVGREQAAGEVTALLRRPDLRLVTLTGPGGTGKTRLALQTAADLLDDYPDGVFFVDLAPISDPALVAPTIATALGLKETPGQSIMVSLKGYLGGRQMLLLLDNFEQIIVAASVVAELLTTAPRLKVLITSREVLHLYGEQEYPVQSLTLPSLTRLPSVPQLSQYTAVQLFIQRAQAARPAFQVTNENALAVAEICARLDGLPLAIELAAVRVKLLPPQALLARLDSRLRLLTGGARNLATRQQTLRNAIAWSYELLNLEEQMLFARLGVFVGGWTLEAAEAVCSTATDLDLNVLDGVASLVDKSLVRQSEAGEGEPRFSMLGTIREYAQERLEASGSPEVVHKQHALYFLALAEEADRTPREATKALAAWRERLEPEHDNLLAALAWSCSRQQSAELALRLGGALEEFWTNKGLFSEGDAWLERVLDHGDALIRQGPAWARALLVASNMAWYRNAFDRSRARAEEALACYRELGDRWGAAAACLTIGAGARLLGEYARAEMFLQESLSLYREIDNTWGIAWTLLILGEALLLDTGEATRAGRYVDEGLLVSRSTGNRLGIASALRLQGTIAFIQSDATRATALLKQSLAVIQDTGETADSPDVLIMLGHIARSQGDHTRAAQLYRESLELLRNTPEDNAWLSKCLEALAGVAVASVTGDRRRSPRLFGAAEALRTAVNAPIPPVARADYQRDVAAARSQLDEGAWAAAWTEGRAMTLEQAISYALEETPDA